LSLSDAVELQKLIDSFAPKTIAEHVDLMTSKLTMKVNLKNVAELSALKWSMSRIVCLVNADVAAMFRRHLPSQIWQRLSEETFSLKQGTSSNGKKAVRRHD
jgi:hypothetical protein